MKPNLDDNDRYRAGELPRDPRLDADRYDVGARWPDLIPFEDEDGRVVPDFPLATLPDTLRGFVESITAHLLTPVDLPAVALLATLSAAVAGRVRLRVAPDWFEPANLYLLAVLPPSTHKSPVLKLATEPFEQEEKDLVERWRAEELERTAERDEAEREIKRIARKAGHEARIRELTAKCRALATPPRPCLIADDATSEALIRKLLVRPVFVAAAEGRPFELMSGLYRSPGQDDADVYLKAWSEDPIRNFRATKGDVHVPRPTLTMFLAVQPVVISKLAKREDFRGRGLIARFLCSFPRTQIGHRDVAATKPIDGAARAAYGYLIRRLLELTLPTGDTSATIVTMTADANAAFVAYRQELEAQLRKGAALAEWRDLGGKLAGHCARMALVIHMARHGAGGSQVAVEGMTMRHAIELARYFTAHTIEAWDGCVIDPPGARVVRWLAEKPVASVQVREIQRRFSRARAFETAPKVRAIVEELAQRGYLLAGGAADVWMVNPRLRAGSADTADRGGNGDGRPGDSAGAACRHSVADVAPTAPTAQPVSAVSERVGVKDADTAASRNTDQNGRSLTVSALSVLPEERHEEPS